MPKTRQAKELTIGQLTDLFRRAKSLVFATGEKIPVSEVEKLRREAKKQGAHYTVAKKTLLTRAMKDAGIELDAKSIKGNFATIVGLEDEVAPAKLVAAFAKDHEAMQIVGGVLEGKTMDAKAVIALAKLPGKQELLGKLVGTLQAPIGGFVNVLAGNLRGLVTVLKAVQDKKTA